MFRLAMVFVVATACFSAGCGGGSIVENLAKLRDISDSLTVEKNEQLWFVDITCRDPLTLTGVRINRRQDLTPGSPRTYTAKNFWQEEFVKEVYKNDFTKVDSIPCGVGDQVQAHTAVGLNVIEVQITAKEGEATFKWER